MSRKAEPSRRQPRPRPVPEAQVATRAARKVPVATDVAIDSDFGLALALGPALRKRSDA
ncbi:MAG: hypothetical protein ACXWLM_01300 [Myxococcales bacterium]